MSDVHGGDDFEASLTARFGQETETTEETEPEAAPEPEAAAEPEPETEAADPLRDESGRFTNDQKLLEEYGLTQFKSIGDALKSYRELQGLQGRQAQEIGEIRQQLQDLAAVREQQPVSWDDYDAATAAQIAFERGDTHRFQQAMTEWKDEDPFAAAVWVADQKRQAELTQLRQEYESRLVPVQQRNQQQMTADAYQAVAARIPDINQFGDGMLQAAETAPEIVAILQSGTQQDVERVFENLYWLAKGRQADTVNAAAAQAAAAQTEANRQAKTQAVVASASSTPAPAEGKDAIDRFKQSILGAETGLVDRFANP